MCIILFQFNKHIRKAEGQKTPRVELTISADGVTVQDPKTKVSPHTLKTVLSLSLSLSWKEISSDDQSRYYILMYSKYRHELSYFFSQFTCIMKNLISVCIFILISLAFSAFIVLCFYLVFLSDVPTLAPFLNENISYWAYINILFKYFFFKEFYLKLLCLLNCLPFFILSRVGKFLSSFPLNLFCKPV